MDVVDRPLMYEADAGIRKLCGFGPTYRCLANMELSVENLFRV
jgi:hypothetical protein